MFVSLSNLLPSIRQCNCLHFIVSLVDCSAALRLVEPTNNFKLKGILLANRAAARMAQRRYVHGGC